MADRPAVPDLPDLPVVEALDALRAALIDGTSQIKASALIPAGLAKGEHKLEFGVTVQACDDKTCLAPTDLPVTVKLKVQ